MAIGQAGYNDIRQSMRERESEKPAWPHVDREQTAIALKDLRRILVKSAHSTRPTEPSRGALFSMTATRECLTPFFDAIE